MDRARALPLIAATMLLGAVSTSAHAAKVVVVNQNIAGERTDRKPDWKGVKVEAESGAHVVTMQEACTADFNGFRDHFRPRGWDVRFVAMKKFAEKDLDECGKGDKGLVIAAKHKLENVRAYPLPVLQKLPGQPGYIGGREFFLFCADVPAIQVPGRLRFCTTHLWAGHTDTNDVAGANEAIRAEQAAEIARILEAEGRNRRIILTGDFNSVPRSAAMDQIYRVNRDRTINTGNRFWEVDQSYDPICGAGDRLCRGGRVTRPLSKEKGDYIFASYLGVNPHTGLSLTELYTPGRKSLQNNHHLMKAWINFRD